METTYTHLTIVQVLCSSLQIDNKKMSDDSDYEEEEYLVFADFKNQILPKELSDENSAIKIIGIETKNPVAEINGNIFKGTCT